MAAAAAILALLLLLVPAAPALAAAGAARESLATRHAQGPSADQVWALLTLRDYNARVVLLGATALGLASGVIGSFMLLRKRALMGDALSHATLPGVGAAFLISSAAGGSGKSLPFLLLGALISGCAGVGCILFIRRFTRLKEDVALGIVLSVFFGAGVAILGVIQGMGTGHAAGLESFIYGKTASMLASDAWLIAAAALVVTLVCGLLFKEFALLCFDQDYARYQGWPVLRLDLIMMAMVVLVTVIGLQAVGLVLVIALLIIPAAAARFWSNHLPTMVVASGLVGAGSAALGAGLSALYPDLPSGAMIVVTAASLFVLSMLLAPRRGALPRWLEHRRLARRIARQHLLRAVYERTLGGVAHAGVEPLAIVASSFVSRAELLRARSWSAGQLGEAIARAKADDLIHLDPAGGGGVALTPEGLAVAARLTRNHRLWELFLITRADIAPSHVDRDAEEVEHVLDPAMVASLEAALARELAPLAMPASPHLLARGNHHDAAGRIAPHAAHASASPNHKPSSSPGTPPGKNRP